LSSAAAALREGAATVNELAADVSARAPLSTADVIFANENFMLFTLLSDYLAYNMSLPSIIHNLFTELVTNWKPKDYNTVTQGRYFADSTY
jgi:hypothetical protein